jgi:hypothetical protein
MKPWINILLRKYSIERGYTESTSVDRADVIHNEREGLASRS